MAYRRLESVASAHTAADLHVHPVSKTALVSNSWAPRTLLEIHDAGFLAIFWFELRRDSRPTLQCCGSSSRKQVFESPQGIVRV